MQQSFIITGLLSVVMSASLTHAAIIAPSCTFDSFTGTDQKSLDGNFMFHSGSYGRAPEFVEGTAVFGPEGTDILNITKVSGASASLGNIGGNGTTITMTISGLSLGSGNAPHALFTATSNTSKWGLGLTADGKLTGTWNDTIWGGGGNKQLDIDSGSLVLTAVSQGSDTLVYVNGTYLNTLTGLGSSTGTGINYLMVGSTASGSDKGASFTLDNLYVHDRALNASEISDFVASIPEPATASLSLLGFSALLLRRRCRTGN